MRDYPVNKDEFNSSVEKRIKSMLHRKSEDLRSDVVNNSNFHYDSLTFFFLKDLTLKDMIRLAILSWYLPKEVSIVLQLDLEQKLRNFASEDRIILEIILSSKAEMLIFLQETTLWHSRDFFGNILDGKTKLDRFLRISPLRRKITRPQRKRGYHDHGSRVPDHQWKPRFDYSLTEKMNQIYEQRQSHRDTLAFIQGCLY